MCVCIYTYIHIRIQCISGSTRDDRVPVPRAQVALLRRPDLDGSAHGELNLVSVLRKLGERGREVARLRARKTKYGFRM